MNYLQKPYKASKLVHQIAIKCRKLVSLVESLTAFDKSFKVTSVPFFIPDFHLVSCELDNFTFKCYIESFYTDIILK